MDLGKRIKQLREKRGIQQLELANKINVSQSKMNKIETGYQKKIEPDILNDIAKSLGIKVDDLLNETDDPEYVDFLAFIAHDPEMQRFFKEFPKSKEENRRKLYKMWEILKDEEE